MANHMYHKVAKGVVQDGGSGNTMNWWLTNFNMPVPQIFDGNWVEDRGPFTYNGEATSFDLSTESNPPFYPGFEVAVFMCGWHWDGPLSGTAYIYSQWRDTDDNLMFTCANGMAVNLNISSGYWSEYMYGCNQGVCGWEIDISGNYKVRSWSTGTGAMAQQDTTIAFSNVPDTTQLGINTPGHIWVEGNNLAYICADKWKHQIYGVYVANPGVSKAGYIWIDTDNYINWVGANGFHFKTAWKIKQFASTWSNSSTGETYAGTDKAGCIWVDNEFGLSHLAYIGTDGYKYLAGAGNYPY